jgi:hypothetical protein
MVDFIELMRKKHSWLSLIVYIMAREAVYIRIILEEMGHKQPPTPLQTNTSMAKVVINGKVQSKQTKAMDM